MQRSGVPMGMRRPWARALVCAVWMGVALVAAGGTARADHEVEFRWRETVRGGPDETLRFEDGARLLLFAPSLGRFEFVGQARETGRRPEDYVVTLTFRDWDDQILFRIASEPFEMEDGRSSRIVVFGEDPLIARFWDEIASVELDAQVPGEPLFEDSFDFYGYVIRYLREQELEGRRFRDF